MPKKKQSPIQEDTKPIGTAPEVSGKLLDNVDNDVSEAGPAAKKAKHESGPKPSLKADKISTAQVPVSDDDPLEDDATDMAVTDIAAKEGNTLLALQDAIGDKATRVAGDLADQDRRKARHRHWAWLIFFVLLILIILLALPLSPHTCHWPLGIRLRVTTDILPSVCK